ncbi:hypothetical protein IQ07DRAFT_93101 [Pyrenochaeta sp. DS3sAY3a]|nr:hypothetical protein IQ07DRAFT_93101 [Pyrenochaeta sp. DS3sAY3a]
MKDVIGLLTALCNVASKPHVKLSNHLAIFYTLGVYRDREFDISGLGGGYNLFPVFARRSAKGRCHRRNWFAVEATE